MAKEREAFEKQVLALEVDMNNLKKGIITPTPTNKKEPKDSSSNGQSNLAHDSLQLPDESPKITKKKSMIKDANASTSSPTALALSSNASFYVPQPAALMPSGTRVSDWAFVGDISSSPPLVKIDTMTRVYETIRLLGRGAFGEVNLVKNIDDNKLYACKSIYCENETDLSNILSEIKFLRQHRHPCIIDIHDGFLVLRQTKNILYIIMQYCETGDLGKVITNAQTTKKNIPESQIIKWIIQIALALHYLHESGVLHRDLKPCNVMLTEGGDQIKLVDFGLAIELNENNECNSANEAGTPYYTSPEMIQSKPYSYPADCWSFGVMLHELLALEMPFNGSSTADLVKSILIDLPPPLPTHYSVELRNVVVGLLNKNPTDRLGMASLLSDTLFASKVLQYPSSYRPKAAEERLRRTQVKQITAQLECLKHSKKSSSKPLSSCLETINVALPDIIGKGKPVESPSNLINKKSNPSTEMLIPPTIDTVAAKIQIPELKLRPTTPTTPRDLKSLTPRDPSLVKLPNSNSQSKIAVVSENIQMAVADDVSPIVGGRKGQSIQNAKSFGDLVSNAEETVETTAETTQSDLLYEQPMPISQRSQSMNDANLKAENDDQDGDLSLSVKRTLSVNDNSIVKNV